MPGTKRTMHTTSITHEKMKNRLIADRKNLADIPLWQVCLYELCILRVHMPAKPSEYNTNKSSMKMLIAIKA